MRARLCKTEECGLDSRRWEPQKVNEGEHVRYSVLHVGCLGQEVLELGSEEGGGGWRRSSRGWDPTT